MKQKNIEPKENKAVRRNKIWFAIIIAFLMITSVFAVFVYNTEQNTDGSNTNTLDYGGYKFYKADLKWALYFNNQYIYFDFSPKELEGISVEGGVSIPSSSQKIYLAQDYSKERANQDFSVNHLRGVLSLVGVSSVLSCTSETGCPDIPLVSCSGDKDVLYIKVLEGSKTSRIYKDGKCTVFEGDNAGVLKAINKYEYFILGVVRT